MSGFHWKVDRRALAKAVVRKAAESALQDAADFLLEEANRTVPIEESTLMGSGQATQEGLKAVVSYDTPYACRQHEETGYRHNSGRRAKWLELTFKEQQGKVKEHIASKMKAAIP